MAAQKLAPLHPGEVLLEEFVRPLDLSQNQLARELKVPRRINEIILGKRGITADTALRLARHFGTSSEFWLGLQADYELDVARDQSEEQIIQEVRGKPQDKAAARCGVGA